MIKIVNGQEIVLTPDEVSAWEAEQAASLPVPPTLAEAMAAKLSEVAEYRLAVETGGIVFGGVPIPTDRATASIITAAYVTASADASYVVENWKVSDTTFITLDAPTIISLAEAVRAHIQTSFNRNASMSAEVQALATAAAVNAFDVEAEWNADPVP